MSEQTKTIKAPITKGVDGGTVTWDVQEGGFPPLHEEVATGTVEGHGDFRLLKSVTSGHMLVQFGKGEDARFLWLGAETMIRSAITAMTNFEAMQEQKTNE